MCPQENERRGRTAPLWWCPWEETRSRRPHERGVCWEWSGGENGVEVNVCAPQVGWELCLQGPGCSDAGMWGCDGQFWKTE